MLQIYWILLLVLLVFVLFLTQKGKDPYGTFHLALNRVHEDERHPQTEWLNMGYWKNTGIFPEACQALALHLVTAAAPIAGGRVLDVGHGSGDSLLLQLSHPAIPRPSILCGITSLSAHHIRSKQRVEDFLSSDASLRSQTRVILHQCDAVCSVDSNVEHPLSPSASDEFTTILALDCAYHFHTRSDFLRQSYPRLAPGGRIALADICFSSSPNMFLSSLFSIIGIMPRENMITKEQYIRDLQEIGFVDISVEDITDWVFPGFQSFLGKQGGAWKWFGRMIGWLERWKGRFVIVTAARPVYFLE